MHISRALLPLCSMQSCQMSLACKPCQGHLTVHGVQQACGTFCMSCKDLILSHVYPLRSYLPCDTVLSALGLPNEAACVSSSEVVHLHPSTDGQTQTYFCAGASPNSTDGPGASWLFPHAGGTNSMRVSSGLGSLHLTCSMHVAHLASEGDGLMTRMPVCQNATRPCRR